MNALGYIAGTGYSDWLAGVKHVIDTPYGAMSAPLQELDINKRKVYYLSRHGIPHRLAPHAVNYRANLWGFRQLGVKHIIAINVVGSIRPEWDAGSLVLPDQIIDYTWGRAHSYFDGSDQPVQHIDFTRPYSKSLQRLLLEAAELAGLKLHTGGVYAATQGPRLETAAEVQRIQRDGGDLIGMTGMPEASLARELDIDYASVCVVSNLAAGIGSDSLSIEDIHRNIATSTEQLQQLAVNV